MHYVTLNVRIRPDEQAPMGFVIEGGNYYDRIPTARNYLGTEFYTRAAEVRITLSQPWTGSRQLLAEALDFWQVRDPETMEVRAYLPIGTAGMRPRDMPRADDPACPWGTIVRFDLVNPADIEPDPVRLILPTDGSDLELAHRYRPEWFEHFHGEYFRQMLEAALAIGMPEKEAKKTAYVAAAEPQTISPEGGRFIPHDTPYRRAGLEIPVG